MEVKWLFLLIFENGGMFSLSERKRSHKGKKKKKRKQKAKPTSFAKILNIRLAREHRG